MSADSSSPQTRDPQSRNGLPLWAVLALSLSIVGPTLAMNGNGQSLASSSVGKSIPLVFLLGLICVALVAYGFISLTRHMSHSGSAYALVGRTVSPRAGFFSGFAMIATYTGFAIACAGLFASFFNAFLALAQGSPAHPFQLPWIVPALIAIAGAVALTYVDAKIALTVLLWVEGVGILFMLILGVVIFVRGGAAGVRAGAPGIDWSVFTFGNGTTPNAVLGGIVIAFLSFAGFEGVATLGEESQNPKKTIPRVLGGTIILTGGIFILMMFAETVGFGTDKTGLGEFGNALSSLGTLANSFIGSWFGMIIAFAAMMSSFACLLGSAATSGRLVRAFARDGFFPKPLAKLDEKTEAPKTAILTVIAIALIINVITYIAKWPNDPQPGVTDNLASDSYAYYATIGAITLMVAYLMVEIAAIWFVNARKFHAVTRGRGRVLGTILCGLGAIAIAVVLIFNIQTSTDWYSPAYIALAWCLLGLIIALIANKLTSKIGRDLAKQIDLGESATQPQELAEDAVPHTQPASEM